MDVTPSQSRVLKFGVFEVNLEARELRKSGILLKLAPQHFQALQLFLERPQEIVTREELQQRIWPKDTFVDYDLALKKAVNRLREVLGDSAESPRFIETIPRRGYRFMATVEGVGGSAMETGGREEGPWRWRWLGWTAAVVCFAVIASALFALNVFKVRDRVLGSAPVPRIQSLAVLPLTNLSSDPAQEYFSDGMTDALITDLAQIGSVKIISRTSIMGYKKTNKPLPEIARELNVDGIIEGTVQRSGDRVRITAQLIHGPSDKHLWAGSYERDLRDVFALERDVSQEIARQIRAQVTTQKPALLAQRRPVNLKALDAYLQGNYHLHRFSRGFGDEEQMEAQKYFQQAIDTDPNFAPAYDRLARAYFDRLWPSSQDAMMSKRAAERAVELDPESSDARVTLADVKIKAWDWRGAEGELRRAIALNPNNALAHHHLGYLFDAMRRLDEGWKEYQIAQELDPNNNHLSDALNLRGDNDRAIAVLLIFLKREPDNGSFHLDLYYIYVEKGMHKEAVQELETAATLFGLPETAASIHRAFAISGYRGAMRQWAKELEHLEATKQAYGPGNLAAVYSALGDKDRAFYWLEEAYKHHDILAAGADIEMESLNADTMFDPLRSDSRFKDLVRRVGLPP